MSEIRIYDVGTDEFRPVTQADVDNLMQIALSYSNLMGVFHDAEKRHAAMYPKQSDGGR